MRKGFIFDVDKCVGCKACIAGCILENGWDFQPRTIYSFNSEAVHDLPVLNLSLACNHCEKPLCLEGCPSGAFKRDKETGAVILSENKCIGCRYCTWNCPYDAPVPIVEKGTVSKCNLCFSLVMEGYKPACTSACPTGALDYGDLSSKVFNNKLLPDRDLNPAIEIYGVAGKPQLHISPERKIKSSEKNKEVFDAKIKEDFSLAVFTFLTTIAVALVGSSYIKDTIPGKFMVIPIIIVSAISSLFHLGKPQKAWRAIINNRTSFLSREITFFVLFFLSAISYTTFDNNLFLLISSVLGLILLVLIDQVYTFSYNRKDQYLHSGQTFLSGLLFISFFTGMKISFLFIALIKIVLAIYLLINSQNHKKYLHLRFFNIAILFLFSVNILAGMVYDDPFLLFILLTGEFSGRLLYYIDFNPVSIKDMVKTYKS